MSTKKVQARKQVAFRLSADLVVRIDKQVSQLAAKGMRVSRAVVVEHLLYLGLKAADAAARGK